MILKNTVPVSLGASQGGQKINWLQLIVAFILGILLASNILLFWGYLSMQKEVEKLKADDVAIAQAVNNILSQIQPQKK